MGDCSTHDVWHKCSLLYAASLTLSKWEKNGKNCWYHQKTLNLMEIYKGVLFIGFT